MKLRKSQVQVQLATLKHRPLLSTCTAANSSHLVGVHPAPPNTQIPHRYSGWLHCLHTGCTACSTGRPPQARGGRSCNLLTLAAADVSARMKLSIHERPPSGMVSQEETERRGWDLSGELDCETPCVSDGRSELRRYQALLQQQAWQRACVSRK